MAINLDCPRCKARLRVPNKKAEGYVNCPHCKGRFWVDKAAPADATATESVTMAVPPDTLPPSPLPPLRASLPLPPATPAASSAPPAPPPVITPVPRSGRKVARFISAEAAQSTLQLAADGKLPELHLLEGNREEKQEAKTSSLSPLTLFGIVALSVVLAIVIAMLGDSTPANNAAERANAWRQIEADYFSDPGGRELKEYNRLLREAKQAQQAQDLKTERALFRKLLDQLRAERDVNEKGLTGSRERDKKLEEHVTVLLNGLNRE